MDVEIGDDTYEVKEGLLYNKSNMWFNPDDGAVGISDYAQAQLGEISFIELSLLEEGMEVSQAEYDGNDPSSDPVPDASIESSKTVAEIFSPVSGTISAINSDDLEMEPEKLNEDPYGAWLIKIDASDLDNEKGNLMDAAAYADFIKSL